MRVSNQRFIRFVIFVAALFWAFPAAADVSNDHSAPYIVVTSDNATPDSLPLKSTRAEVQIAGVMAHVTVTQVYENLGDIALEAVYVFPGSTDAAVFGMQMRIGDRVTKAKIEKRETARRLYEAAKSDGQTATLLEQHRPNVFQMNVANILPGDTVEVKLQYTELMRPKDGVYEFVYPAVVGPRYAGEQNTGETWHENSYAPAGASAPYGFGVQFAITTGVPLQGLSSPSHKISPAFDGTNSAHFALSDAHDGDRDFVLRYRLRGGSIETGLLRFEEGDENFFLLMVQPPKTTSIDDMPAREYVFIVDVSGSMAGFPLSVSKKLIANILGGLRAKDSFNLMFFAGGSYQLSPKSVPATKANVTRALRVLDEQRGGGGTNLVAALQSALKMPASESTSRTFVAVTDGFITADDSAFQMVRKNLGRANFFAFGVGSSVNRNLIRGLARAGLGEPFVALNGPDANKQAAKFRKLISSPMLTQVRAKFRGINAYDVVPKAIPDLFSDRPLLIFGKYRGKAKGSIEISGIAGRGKFHNSLQVDANAPVKANAGLRYLWARQRIAELSDRIALGESEELTRKVTSLGLSYNLLTRYTSFVAVDPKSRKIAGAPALVKQQLPSPSTINLGAPPPASPLPRGYHFSSSGAEILSEYIADANYSTDMFQRSSNHSAFTVDGTMLTSAARFATRDDRNEFSLPLSFRTGLSDSSELRIASTVYQRIEGKSHSPDLSVGAKLELPSLPMLRLAAVAALRTAFDKADPKQYQNTALLVAETRALGLGLRLNLGLGHLRLRDTKDDRFGFAYAAELSWATQLSRLVLQPYLGVTGLALKDGSESALEFGAVFQIGDDWGVGTEVQLGLTEASATATTGLFLRHRL